MIGLIRKTRCYGSECAACGALAEGFENVPRHMFE
jgi:hypothetical protein